MASEPRKITIEVEVDVYDEPALFLRQGQGTVNDDDGKTLFNIGTSMIGGALIINSEGDHVSWCTLVLDPMIVLNAFMDQTGNSL